MNSKGGKEKKTPESKMISGNRSVAIDQWQSTLFSFVGPTASGLAAGKGQSTSVNARTPQRAPWNEKREHMTNDSKTDKSHEWASNKGRQNHNKQEAALGNGVSGADQCQSNDGIHCGRQRRNERVLVLSQ
jgi:hypothetical protein